MSNNPHQSRSPNEQRALQWQQPVALHSPAGDPAAELGDPYASDPEVSGLHSTGQASEGPGLASELVLTAIVALGVMLATCSALYFAGAFSTPAHHGAPSGPSVR